LEPVRFRQESLVELTLERLLESITAGHFPAHERLPSEHQLAEQLRVSRATVREALGLLQQQGYVFRRAGDGTYVTHGQGYAIERLELFQPIDSVLASQGLQIRPVHTQFSTEPPDPYVAQVLGLSSHAAVHVVARTLVSEIGPMAYMVDFIPTSIMEMDQIRASYSGVIRPLLARVVPDIALAEADIFTTPADGHLARELGLKSGAILLIMEETVVTVKGRPVEFSRNHYNPARFRFRVVQTRTDKL
jgi:GntR family transcriptional regulator